MSVSDNAQTIGDIMGKTKPVDSAPSNRPAANVPDQSPEVEPVAIVSESGDTPLPFGVYTGADRKPQPKN